MLMNKKKVNLLIRLKWRSVFDSWLSMFKVVLYSKVMIIQFTKRVIPVLTNAPTNYLVSVWSVKKYSDDTPKISKTTHIKTDKILLSFVLRYGFSKLCQITSFG